jgi:hypothetical protein
VYEPVVQGSSDGRTAGMFGKAAMVAGAMLTLAVAARTHEAQEGASGWVHCSHWW